MRAASIVIVALLALASPAFAQEQKASLSIKAAADYLALHVNGKAPPETTRLELRFSESGAIAEDAPWLPSTVKPGADGTFTVDIPLPNSRWAVLQMRALSDAKVVSRTETRPRATALKLITAPKIAGRPEPEREAWIQYVERSQRRAAFEREALAAECRKLQRAQSQPAPSVKEYFKVPKTADAAWFSSAETQRLAEAIMSFQTPTGGWSKAVDYAPGPRPPGTHWTSQKGDAWHYCGTIDNSTTTEQIRLLAGVFTTTQRAEVKAATLRGIEYLLEAQFPNGGWPQNYPLEAGYHEAITLNDNAMVHAMELLDSLSRGEAPFAFTDARLRERAAAAVEKAIGCLLATQVRVEKRLTIWCAQHDPLTLEPVWARAKEPPSLSGGETVEALRFVMRRAPLRAEIKTSIEAALAWLDAHKLTGLRKTKTPEGKTDYVEDAESKEVYWARFYDVQTGRPIFPGTDDGVIYATFHEMAAKNKVAYDFITTKPGDLLEKEVPKWRKRLERGK